MSVLDSVLLKTITSISDDNILLVENQFTGNSLLQTVTLNNCKIIGSNAFAGCTSLTEIHLPNCEIINPYAFSGCTSLSILDIHNCKIILANAFTGCTSLTSLSLPECIEFLTIIPSSMNITELCLPKCKVIVNNMLRNNSYITSVNIPNVMYIPESAFSTCKNLQFVNCENAKFISSCAFQSCGIVSINCKPVVVGYMAFNRCYNLTSLDLADCRFISRYALQMYSVTPLVISNLRNLEYLEAEAFNATVLDTYLPKCWYMGSATFRSTFISAPILRNVVASAFAGQNSLESVYFEEAITVGSWAFSGCYNLSDVSLPKCECVYEYAFFNCTTSLTKISLPNCYVISNLAFGNCKALSDISLPKCLCLRTNAFISCTNLSVLSLPMCTSIGGGVFSNTIIESLYLLGSSFVSITNTTFNNSPIVNSNKLGYYGSVFVPMSMYDTYSIATNWVSVSNRLVSV